MLRETWFGVLGACALTVAFPCAAAAGSDKLEPPAPVSAWEFDGGLYGWALWVQGDATTRGLTFDVYADPIDLIEHLDGPIIMANFEARRGPFALYTDIIYSKFAMDSDFLGEATPLGGLTLKGSGRLGADYEFGVYQADGFYEVANFSGATGSNTTLELGGGARWVRQELDVTLAVDLSVTRDIGQRLDRLKERLQRIDNREDRVAALARFNELRQAFIERRIVHDENSPVLKRRVARLENRLKRVDRRGEVIGALEELEKLRVAFLKARIALADKDFSGNFAFANSGLIEWVDPVVAMRMTHEIGNGRSFTAMGDVGGFQADDFSWQVVLTFDCDGKLFGYDTTTSIGYKALGLHYEESSSKGRRGQDVILHGPLAELTFRW
ncbi:MAG: hypothetical protein ACRECX_02785 [Methyloceanibacter sp.]|uniref:hypothetical protein n=1 Tax=Methyloceanibacter sp. TaxID=1965321 RepID=UPI003D6C7585